MDRKLELGSETVAYQVKESQRAVHPRITINISGITVILPKNHTVSPETVLQDKKDWVLQKNAVFKQHRQNLPEREFVNGAEWPLLGQNCRLVVEKARTHRRKDSNIILAEHLVERNGFRQELERFYRNTARQVITEKLEPLLDQLGEDYSKLYIRNQKTKWASCSGRNNMSFNWRLVLAPERVLDYVVVHEACHLVHRDHSGQFWGLVEQLMPEYREAREWLGNNSEQLFFTLRDFS